MRIKPSYGMGLLHQTVRYLVGTSYWGDPLKVGRSSTINTFKTSKNPKEEHNGSCCESYEEKINFVGELKRASRKYKGKLPFKFFNCGKIGHFSSKCPYARGSNSDQEEVHKKEKKYHKRDKKRNKIKSKARKIMWQVSHKFLQVGN